MNEEVTEYQKYLMLQFFKTMLEIQPNKQDFDSQEITEKADKNS